MAGALALMLLLGLGYGFTRLSPAQIRRAMAVFAVLAAVGIIVLVLTLGRGVPAIAMGSVIVALLGSIFGFFSRRDKDAGSRPLSLSGDSVIKTAMLKAQYDRRRGLVSCTVVSGYFTGRELGQMSLGDLLSLFGECQEKDPDSLPVLVAWLDRFHRGWENSLTAKSAVVAPAPAKNTAKISMPPAAKPANAVIAVAPAGAVATVAPAKDEEAKEGAAPAKSKAKISMPPAVKPANAVIAVAPAGAVATISATPEGEADEDAEDAAEPPSNEPSMPVEEALELLGLDASADADAVRRAYRLKMRDVHPDKGGTEEQAAKLFGARTALLRRPKGS
ncbi:hypothetical protein IAI18_08315 [Acetobacteraceae bacterium H6797]|nr:hypothetical protein [Acetobacteraceae bacterium H6797]